MRRGGERIVGRPHAPLRVHVDRVGVNGDARREVLEPLEDSADVIEARRRRDHLSERVWRRREDQMLEWLAPASIGHDRPRIVGALDPDHAGGEARRGRRARGGEVGDEATQPTMEHGPGERLDRILRHRSRGDGDGGARRETASVVHRATGERGEPRQEHAFALFGIQTRQLAQPIIEEQVVLIRARERARAECEHAERGLAGEVPRRKERPHPALTQHRGDEPRERRTVITERRSHLALDDEGRRIDSTASAGEIEEGGEGGMRTLTDELCTDVDRVNGPANLDVDGLGMAAQPLFALEELDIAALVEEPRRGNAGDPATDDRDARPARVHR